MHLRNLNVAPRASLFFASIILLVFVLGAVAAVQMGKLRDAEKDVETNWLPSVRQTALMNVGVMRLRFETQRALADPQALQSTVASFAGYRKTFADAVLNYEPLIANNDERTRYLVVKASADAYAKQLDILEPLMARGDIPAAVNLVSTGIRPLTNRMEGEIKALTDFNNDGATAAGQYATNTVVV